MIDGTVLKKGSGIRFKVEKLKNWVGLGLAIRSIIKGKKFMFECIFSLNQITIWATAVTCSLTTVTCGPTHPLLTTSKTQNSVSQQATSLKYKSQKQNLFTPTNPNKTK